MTASDTNERQVLGGQIDEWISANDPGQPQAGPLLGGGRGPLPAAWSTGAEQAQAAVSKACFIGNGIEAARADSKALKQLIGDKANDAGLARFKAQPLDGCTSVMNIARIAARFNPLDPDNAENVERFRDYTRRILAAPFFNLGYADIKTETRSSKDWTVLIDAIVKLFEGVEAEDRTRIKDGLLSLADAATSQSGVKQKKTLFVQNVLQLDGGTLSVFIYYSSIELEEDKEKGCTSRQSKFTIGRSRLTFRSGDWPHFAEKVWKKQVSVVDDWLDDNDTPAGGEETRLCIRA